MARCDEKLAEVRQAAAEMAETVRQLEAVVRTDSPLVGMDLYLHRRTQASMASLASAPRIT